METTNDRTFDQNLNGSGSPLSSQVNESNNKFQNTTTNIHVRPYVQ